MPPGYSETTVLPRYDDGTVIYHDSKDGVTIEVREQGRFRWMHFGSHAIQSILDKHSPSIPRHPYNIAMLAALLFVQRPQNILNLGVGGGSIERFFYGFYPDTRVTSVELSSHVTAVAREYFFIDKDHPVIEDSAEHFIRSDQGVYDIVFCDIFFMDEHPLALNNADYYEALSQRLNDNGILVLNLLPKSESELLIILRALREALPWGYLFELTDHKNILVFCFKQRPSVMELLEPRAQVLKDAIGLDMRSIPSRLISLNE